MSDLTQPNLFKENSLLRKFEEIHNFFYANDGLSSQQALEEIIKVLFAKIFSENNSGSEFYISPSELREVQSNSTSKEFLLRIHNLFDQTKGNFADIFDSDDKIKLSISSLCFAVDKLQHINLNSISSDAKGIAFQKFLTHHEKDSRGQFFTPEPVIKFCVEFLDPKPTDTIADPACGSGGFLFAVYQHIKNKHKSFDRSKYISKNLWGFDINSSIARIAKMKFLLESEQSSNIFCTNTLDDSESLERIVNSTQKFKIFEGFDIILTNPPFGTEGKITNTKILNQYETGYKWEFKNNTYFRSNTLLKGQSVETLFIERCLQLLKTGGKLGIVLPNGQFENPSLEYIRQYIKNTTKIIGVVNLPHETFIPFGTGVKTSLLFVEKKERLQEEKRSSVFFGRITKLGYQGNKNASPVYLKDSNGNLLINKGAPIIDQDFDSLINDYKIFLKTNKVNSPNAFTIKSDCLSDRLDYNYYSPENKKLISTLNGFKSFKLSDVVSIVNEKSKKIKQKEMTIDYIELSDINTHSFEIVNSTQYLAHELPSRASYEITDGDIITAVAGNSIGTRKHATALVTKEFSGSICTNGFRILRGSKVDVFYLLYYLKSDYFLKQVYMYRTGAAIPNISDKDLGNILVYVPSKKKMDVISRNVKSAFELRKKSRELLEQIKL